MTFLVSFISYDVSSLLIQVISAQKYYKNTIRERKNEKSAQAWQTRDTKNGAGAFDNVLRLSNPTPPLS